MTERQLQFRVGLLVLVSGLVGAGLIFRFGEMRWLWEQQYELGVHFDRAPGVQRGTPVRKNGILIGSVRELSFDDGRGGVNVLVEISERYPLRKDSRPTLSRSLLGDATIEFSPGQARAFFKPGDRLDGTADGDPLELVARIESKMNETLDSFAATSQSIRNVADNLNGLMATEQGTIKNIIEEAAGSLQQVTLTMRNANKTLADPQNQENLRATLAALPEMMEETRRTVHAVRQAVVKADASLGNLAEVTAPLAKRSNSIVTKLDNSVGQLELLLVELNHFTRAMNHEQGSLNLLVTDPALYRNLNDSAATMQTMLRNLEPAIRDLRVFADKIARHPEKIGVGGALKPDSGLK